MSQYGMWIWNLTKCEGGDPVSIAAKCRTVGLDHVVLKITDGTAHYNGASLKPVVQSLKKHGVAVLVWPYTYGKSPEKEAQVFGERAVALGADGMIVDLEGDAYINPDGQERARRYFASLKGAAPTLPLGLSSHRFPSLHARVPIAYSMGWCDFGDPQCYSLPPHVDAQMDRAIREWRAFGKPIAATGAAYPEGTGDPSNIRLFVNACRRARLQVVRFWSWEHCTLAMWEQIEGCTKMKGAYDA